MFTYYGPCTQNKEIYNNCVWKQRTSFILYVGGSVKRSISLADVPVLGKVKNKAKGEKEEGGTPKRKERKRNSATSRHEKRKSKKDTK